MLPVFAKIDWSVWLGLFTLGASFVLSLGSLVFGLAGRGR